MIMSLPAIIAVIILIFLPESPKFLNRGRKDDSTKLKKALKLVQLQVKFKYPIQCIKIHCRVILHLQSRMFEDKCSRMEGKVQYLMVDYIAGGS